MNLIELNGDNFLEQITKYGYFSESIPKCFSTEDFSIHSKEMLSALSGKCVSQPTKLSIYKNDVSRRVLSIPNPESFLKLCGYMKEEWENIKRFAESENSLSSITYIINNPYDINSQVEYLNSESLREAKKLKSNYIDGVNKNTMVSLGYQFQLKVDIANCYNSIYTHSITWAICGKETAKNEFKDKNLRTNDYKIGDKLDTYLRHQKNNETNGIVVGPFTSRIFSEIILSGIDRELRTAGFVFTRFVDDYSFYFKTQYDAESSVQKIERILNEYNLNLNLAKTKINRFPYIIYSEMKELYKLAYNEKGWLGVLSEAGKQHNNGEKGAYKYALKFLRDKDFNVDDLKLIIPNLINIMILEPKYGKYIIDLIKTNNIKFVDIDLNNVINNELKDSIKDNRQQETLIYFYMIRELGLTLSSENLRKILTKDDDLSILIALDLWKNFKNLISKSPYDTRLVNESLTAFCVSLKNEGFDGNRWLLLYELEKGDLIDSKFYTGHGNLTSFFEKMKTKNICFYSRIQN